MLDRKTRPTATPPRDALTYTLAGASALSSSERRYAAPSREGGFTSSCSGPGPDVGCR